MQKEKNNLILYTLHTSIFTFDQCSILFDAGDMDLTPGLGRSSEKRNGNPL